MKKIIATLCIVFGVGVFMPNIAEARSGCCSWHGGVCGCGCCDGTPLSATCAPYYPECSGGHSSPSYSSPSYSTPTCPSNSTYSYLSDSCKCNSGYVTNSGGSGCISGSSYCQSKYGYNSRFNSLSNTCECNYNYIMSGGQCISYDTYCQNLYGFNARHNSLSDKCECGYGYVFDVGILDDLICVSGSTYCHNKYGYHSNFDNLSKECECDHGYRFDGDECVDDGDTEVDYDALYRLLQASNNKCGLNSYSTTDSQCVCDTGYTWEDYADPKNFDCVQKTCPDGYILVSNECISHTKNCEKSFGVNVSGVKGDNNNSSCSCVDGYEWSADQTKCVEKKVEVLGISNENRMEKIKSFIEEERKMIAKADKALTDRLTGKILLQVEGRGEAWYVNPKDKKRYYLADGSEAYNIMRDLGVGITNENLSKMRSDKDFAKKHSGKIFLQVEDRGQAYYIDFDGDAHYLKDGGAAYTIMRELGLGIANDDIRKVGIAE